MTVKVVGWPREEKFPIVEILGLFKNYNKIIWNVICFNKTKCSTWYLYIFTHVRFFTPKHTRTHTAPPTHLTYPTSLHSYTYPRVITHPHTHPHPPIRPHLSSPRHTSPSSHTPNLLTSRHTYTLTHPYPPPYMHAHADAHTIHKAWMYM